MLDHVTVQLESTHLCVQETAFKFQRLRTSAGHNRSGYSKQHLDMASYHAKSANRALRKHAWWQQVTYAELWPPQKSMSSIAKTHPHYAMLCQTPRYPSCLLCNEIPVVSDTSNCLRSLVQHDALVLCLEPVFQIAHPSHKLSSAYRYILDVSVMHYCIGKPL